MTNKDKVNKILNNLSEKAICFVSERHLQVEFAIEAKKYLRSVIFILNMCFQMIEVNI